MMRAVVVRAAMAVRMRRRDQTVAERRATD
jgi:hypothetical protein